MLWSANNMLPFSERMGQTRAKAMQLDDMDGDLRNGLWNVAYDVLFRPFLGDYFKTRESAFVQRIWRDFLKQPVDGISYSGQDIVTRLKTFFLKEPWYRVYDFIEFLAQCNHDYRFPGQCNAILKREMSGYRFSGVTLVPITSAEELAEVSSATQLNGPLSPVGAHISRAVALFSNRDAPDYRNAIKESISAVEALCKIVTGEDKATLGDALKKLGDKITIHAALKKAFSNLYGYTNDAQGIRHALLEESTLDFEDAKFMLVSCSCFVNYVAAKARQVGVLPAGS